MWSGALCVHPVLMTKGPDRSPLIVDKKKPSVARLNIGLCYPSENANFSFWAFVFKPVCHSGGQLETPLYNISGWFRNNMDGTLFVRAPSPCRPGTLSPDRLLTQSPLHPGPASICARGGQRLNHRCCATDRRNSNPWMATISGWPGTVMSTL
jgi:hypothetical protein